MRRLTSEIRENGDECIIIYGRVKTIEFRINELQELVREVIRRLPEEQVTDPSDSEEKYAGSRVLRKGAAANNTAHPAIPAVAATAAPTSAAAQPSAAPSGSLKPPSEPRMTPTKSVSTSPPSPTIGKRKAENSGVGRSGKRRK